MAAVRIPRSVPPSCLNRLPWPRANPSLSPRCSNNLQWQHFVPGSVAKLSSPRLLLVAGMVGAILVVALMLPQIFKRHDARPAARVLIERTGILFPVSNTSGPSFSPDGNSVAFYRQHSAEAESGIYVTSVGSCSFCSSRAMTTIAVQFGRRTHTGSRSPAPPTTNTSCCRISRISSNRQAERCEQAAPAVLQRAKSWGSFLQDPAPL